MSCINSKEYPLFLSSVLAEKLGLKASLFLEKLHYWLTHSSKDLGLLYQGKRWIHNTAKGWISQLSVFSERTFQRVIANLREQGIISTENLSPQKHNRTNYYTIDYTQLEKVCGIRLGFCPHEKFQNLISTQDEQLSSTKKNTPNAKMACSSRQNGGIYIDTINTSRNLSLISSEEKEPYTDKSNTNVKQAQENKEHKNNENKLERNEDHPEKKEVIQKTPVAKTLISIWNEVIEEGKELVALTKMRVRFLLAAFREKFESSVEKWRDFCQKIASSRFLMGEITSFKASFDWVLKYPNMQKVLDGNYKSGDREIFQEEPIQDLAPEINTSETRMIQDLRNLIYKALGSDLYNAWFAPIQFKERGEEIIFRCPSVFHRNYVEMHYLNRIDHVLKKNRVILELLLPDKEEDNSKIHP